MADYEMPGGYTLWHGDCLEQMDRIEAGSVDAIICDLPYGTTACAFDTVIPFEPLWRQYKRVIKKNGAIVLFGDEPFTSLLIMSNLDWFRYRWTWRKSRPTGFLDSGHKPLSDSEDLPVFYKAKPTYNPQMQIGKPNHVKNGVAPKSKPTAVYHKFTRVAEEKSDKKHPRLVLDFASLNPAHNLHPTQKPVALLSYLIKTYTNEGETVLDSTMGSGSTGEACLRTGRRFIGIEKDAHYYQVASDRLARVAAELRGELNHLPMFAEAA